MKEQLQRKYHVVFCSHVLFFLKNLHIMGSFCTSAEFLQGHLVPLVDPSQEAFWNSVVIQVVPEERRSKRSKTLKDVFKIARHFQFSKPLIVQ